MGKTLIKGLVIGAAAVWASHKVQEQQFYKDAVAKGSDGSTYQYLAGGAAAIAVHYLASKI